MEDGNIIKHKAIYVTFKCTDYSNNVLLYQNENITQDEIDKIPSKTGYSTKFFVNETEINLLEYIFTNETNVDIVYDPNKYTIYFNFNGGKNGTEQITATYDTTIPTSITAPEKTGYIFEGYLDSESNIFYSKNLSTDVIFNLTNDLTLFAKWNTITYNITYIYNGGYANNPANYNIETETFTLNNPTKKGYNFTGWTGDETGSNYEIIYYTIDYNYNNGIAENPSVYTIETDTITLNNPEKIAYTFTGWTGYNILSLQKDVKIVKGSTENRYYTANFTPISYIVTYNYFGGTADNIISYNIESQDITVNEPQKTGYTFTGWTGDFSGKNVIITTGNYGNKTLIANYNANTYIVTLNADGGTGGTEKINATFDSLLPSNNLSAPNKNGYTFIGYYLDENQYYTKDMTSDITYTIADNTTLVAKYNVITYNIEYILNGGNASNIGTYTIESNDITINNPSKTGYDFTGWSGDFAGTDIVITKGTFGNKTLTANYQIINYTINYNLNGGIAENVGTYTIITPDFTLNNPTKTGYEFTGWTEDYIGLSVTITVGTYGDINLNANYKANTYTVAFDFNEGSDGSLSVDATFDSVMPTFGLVAPTRKGYTFNGYSYNDKQYYTKNMTSNTVYDIADNITLTADWTPNQYKIIFDYKGATSGNTENEKIINYDEVVTNLPTPIKDEYYSLEGWYYNDELFENGTVYNFEHDITLTAIYIYDINLFNEQYSYTITDSNVTITEFKDTEATNVVIPENITIDNELKTITKINAEAFKDKSNITNLVVPDSVVEIGEGAFSGCSGLVSISLPFVGNKRAEYSTSTYQYTFGYVFGKTEYTGSTATEQKYIASTSDLHWASTATYYIPASIKKVTITSSNIISYGTFYNCNTLTDITINNGTTYVGESAFYNCTNLLNLSVPQTITTFETAALNGCNKIKYTLYNNGYYLGNTDNPYTVLVKLKTKTVQNFSFRNDTKVIYYSCFSGSKVTTLNIPDNVVYIGNYAFSSCTELKYIKLSENIEIVNDCLFRECSNLTEIVIPDNVKSIKTWVFYKCTNLEKVTFGDNLTSIGLVAFGSCTSLKDIVWGAKAVGIGQEAFSNCTALTELTVSDNISGLSWGAFANCTGLKQITFDKIPFSSNPFYGCINIERIIGNVDYYNTDAMKNSNAVISSTGTLYSGCKNTIIPETVKTIFNYAFCNYNNLYTIYIPKSVIYINDYAFSLGNSGLGKIYYGGISTEWNNIRIGTNNNSLSNATIFYYSATKPASDGNYWHYGESGEIIEWTPENLFTYEEQEDYVTITGLNYNISDIVIPDTINNKPVTSFGQVFKLNKVIEKITIGNNITSIDSAAFSNCFNLKTVIMSDSVTTIGESAFASCSSLTSIQLSNITTINKSTFHQCYALTEIIWGNNITTIGELAFYNCTSLEEVTLPNKVTSIGKGAFNSCSSLKSISLSNNLITINENAFLNCLSLTSIYIPSRVSSVGQGVFSQCSSLSSIVVGERNNYYRSDDCNAIISKDGKTIVAGCNATIIPESVLYLGAFSMRGLTLTDFTIPDNVQSIGYYSVNTSDFVNVVIGSGVTSISEQTFHQCANLKNVFYKGTSEDWSKIAIGNYNDNLINATRYYYTETRPTTVGNYWHYNENSEVEIWGVISTYGNLVYEERTDSVIITSLVDNTVTSQVIPDKIHNKPVIDFGTIFNGNTTILTVNIGQNVKEIAKNAFKDCTNLKTVILPDNLTKIGYAAFFNCVKLTDIIIPDYVETIKSCAFYNCSSLTSITLPYFVTEIPECAFFNCINLEHIYIKGDIKSVGTNAFADCKKLNLYEYENGYYLGSTKNPYMILIKTNIDYTSFTINSNTKFLYQCAFQNSNITSIVIPDSVVNIGTFTFYQCKKLKNIVIGKNCYIESVTAFIQCPNIETIIVNANNKYYDSRDNCNAIIETATNKLFFGCINTIIPNTVTNIGNCAFMYCNNMDNMILPKSITWIGNQTFQYCTSLQNVYYEGSVKDWNNITIGTYNAYLTDSVIHYYSDTQPTVDGNYWHYNESGEIVEW